MTPAPAPAQGALARAAFVGVDWGTSSFRAWSMTADGTVLAHTRGGEGMLHCIDAGFAPTLALHLERLGAPSDLPVLMCGMVGARQGWKEAPYLFAPTRLDTLQQGAVRIDTPRDVRILPGIADAKAASPDVMRGEETQLLGAIAPDFTGLVCIPGTHSKWITLEDGQVVGFATYMTGEMFSVLSGHSILSHAVDPAHPPKPSDAAFRDGVLGAARQPSALTNALFRIRAAQLLGQQQRSDGAARLSGLLIGTEIAAALDRHPGTKSVQLIGAGALCELYAAALTMRDVAVNLVDAEEASRQGLAEAARRLWFA